MIVAFGSGRSRLVGRSAAAFKSIDVARIVAFGSNVCGAIKRPPSNVQNFWPSSGNVRLHLGQLFIHTDLLNGSQDLIQALNSHALGRVSGQRHCCLGPVRALADTREWLYLSGWTS